MGVGEGVRVIEGNGNNNEDRLQGSSETACARGSARDAGIGSALARGSRRQVSACWASRAVRRAVGKMLKASM